MTRCSTMEGSGRSPQCEDELHDDAWGTLIVDIFGNDSLPAIELAPWPLHQ